jgi:hypothetical protein
MRMHLLRQLSELTFPPNYSFPDPHDASLHSTKPQRKQ